MPLLELVLATQDTNWQCILKSNFQVTENGVCTCSANKGKGLSGGAGFGIFILVVAIIALGAAVGLFFLKKKKPETFSAIKDNTVGRARDFISKFR